MEHPSVNAVVEKVSFAAFGKPLITNVLRGQVAEAIVALALEPDWQWCSADYSGWDFENSDGVRLEVKHSAAKQSWATVAPSRPSFDIAKRTGYWDEGVNWISSEQRAAHIYVFAYHGIFDDQADHRDPRQWTFYVVDSRDLPEWKSIGIAGVQARAAPATYSQLAESVSLVSSRLSLRKNYAVGTDLID